MTVTGKDSDI